MISASYLGSAASAVVLGVLLSGGTLTEWSFIALVGFALFFAIGTGLGGIVGPLLFGQLIATGEASVVAIGCFIGAAIMAVGGIVEIFFGIDAEGQSLERIARPLTAEPAGMSRPARGTV